MGPDEDGTLADDIDQLETIVARLRARSEDEAALRLAGDRDVSNYVYYAQTIFEGRVKFKRSIPGDYFVDPAFDMMLDLFIATETGRKRSFKSAAIASRVPPATASRYLDMMTRDGLVVREPDADDGRRILLSLTPQAMAGMREWLGMISAIMVRNLRAK